MSDWAPPRSSPLYGAETWMPCPTPKYGKAVVATAISTAVSLGATIREPNTDPDVSDDDMLVSGFHRGFCLRFHLQVFSESNRPRLRAVTEACCVAVKAVFASVTLGRVGLWYDVPYEESLNPSWMGGERLTNVWIDTWLGGSVLNDALLTAPIPEMFRRERTEHGMWIVFNGGHDEIREEHLKALSDVVHPQLMIVGEHLRNVPAPIRGRVKKGPPAKAFAIRASAEFGVLSLRTDTEDADRHEALRDVVEEWANGIFRYGPEVRRTDPVFRGEVRWRYDTSPVGIHEIPDDLDELLRRVHAVEGVTVTEASFKDGD